MGLRAAACAQPLPEGLTEELTLNFPQLTLGEVYSVLAWFSDHRESVMRHLEVNAADASAMALEARHQRIANELRESGKLKSTVR